MKYVKLYEEFVFESVVTEARAPKTKEELTLALDNAYSKLDKYNTKYYEISKAPGGGSWSSNSKEGKQALKYKKMANDQQSNIWKWTDKLRNLGFEYNTNESEVTESVFTFKTDNIEQLHFETDPKKAEEMKIELGKMQGEVSKRKQIEGGEYSLRRFRKEIGYGNGKDVGVFLPGSYDAAVSKLGDGPHKKAVKAVKWNQRKYDQWLEDMAAHGGAENAFDMAQNAKNEPGLIDWVKKNFRGDAPLQRIQWDIEAFA